MAEAPDQPTGADRFADSKMPDLSKGGPGPAQSNPGLGPSGGAVGAGGAAGAGSAAGRFVVEVTSESEFAALVQQSTSVPIVVDLWATWCGPCKQLSPILEKLAGEYGGRFILAKVDVDANRSIAQAFQVQSVPTVVAIVGGRPAPLFQGSAPENQVRAVIEALLAEAAKLGVSGTADPSGALPEPQLPPLHQEAFDAIERGDLDAAKAAYVKALAEAPADAAAKAGLAQVELLQRLQVAEGAPAGEEAADGGLAGVMAAADAAVAMGQPAEGFAQLLAALRAAGPEDKETLRLRLLDLFEVVGASDPSVAKARRELASALF